MNSRTFVRFAFTMGKLELFDPYNASLAQYSDYINRFDIRIYDER